VGRSSSNETEDIALLNSASKHVWQFDATFRRISRSVRLMRPCHVTCVCWGGQSPASDRTDRECYSSCGNGNMVGGESQLIPVMGAGLLQGRGKWRPQGYATTMIRPGDAPRCPTVIIVVAYPCGRHRNTPSNLATALVMGERFWEERSKPSLVSYTFRLERPSETGWNSGL
jgi:hypothetical protein